MSGRRNLVFANGEYYHIYNRSVGGAEIFEKENDTRRALDLLSFYRFNQSLRYSFYDRLGTEEKKYYLENHTTEPVVDMFAYCLMPNHFHILLKQNEENGIRKFLSDSQNGFAKYYNVKNKRFGSVFQSPFKAKHIETDEEFLHVSRYIHLNPASSFMMNFEELKRNNITSFPLYLSGETGFVNTDFITKIIGSSLKYEKFVEDQVDYQRRLELIKHLILE